MERVGKVAPCEASRAGRLPSGIRFGKAVYGAMPSSIHVLTLHGHIHEAARLTGQWKTRLGRTVCINGAHHGPELALVRFDAESPDDASRQLL